MREQQPLFLTNTLSGKKERFESKNGSQVLLYVCGITPYDYTHIGHGRCYTAFDVLFRLLQFLGYKVRYCRNYTDIDDKLLNRSEQLFGLRSRYQELADKYITAYQESMQKLGCLPPTIEPRVTHNIDPIIAFIKELIAKEYAYESEGDVYFDITKFKEYGKLSHQKIDELLAGTRMTVREAKHHPLDFALWKKDEEEFFWQSPWSIGRPGWHIECSALARTYLGEFVDIHAGGLDLIFPHHENEVAQSEAALGHQFAQCWLHNGLVLRGSEKMSKSLGNIVQLHELLEAHHPMELRYYFLAHQYRTPLPFSDESLHAHAKAYHKLCALLHGAPSTSTMKDIMEHPVSRELLTQLCDDMNIPAMLGTIFEQSNTIKEDRVLQRNVKTILSRILGLELNIIKKEEIHSEQVEKLLHEREKARAEKDWARADQLRDELVKLGVEVQDKKVKK